MGTIDGVTIRQATLADIPALHGLIEASVRGLQTHDYTAAEIDGALGHALGLDSQLIEDGTYFAAVSADGEMVGCGGSSYRATLFGSDDLPDRVAERLNPATQAAKIRAIFVHPRWARRGLGSLILAHCERCAEQAGFRRLEMGSTLTGVPLYTLRGYREQGRIAVALPNGQSLAVVRMTKDVS